MTTQDAIVISVAIVAGVAMFVAILLLIAFKTRAAGRVLHVEHRGRRRTESPNVWRWEVKRECPPPETPKTEPTTASAPTEAERGAR